MNRPTILVIACILFLIGWLASPLIAVLHLPTDVAQVIIGVNWISGGLAFVLIEIIRRETTPPTPPLK
jgi:hypothetical protein